MYAPLQEGVPFLPKNSACRGSNSAQNSVQFTRMNLGTLAIFFVSISLSVQGVFQKSKKKSNLSDSI